MENLSLFDIFDKLDPNLSDYNDKIKFLLDNKNKFTKDDWEKVAQDYDISEEEANDLIIRKEDLGKNNGLDFLILIYNQKFSEDFYNQDYVKDLLNIQEYEYHNIMGRYNSLESGGVLWQNLFYINQWDFSEKFLIENVESFVYTYHFQRYQNVPISIYEKYIDDENFTHVNAYDQDIPAWFIYKYMKKYPNKFHINNFSNVNGLTEDMFVEFLTYDYFKEKENMNNLWKSVGYFNPSEEFLKKNLDKINIKVHKYNSPWNNILSSDNNKVNYSTSFIEDNIEYFGLELLFNGKTNLTDEIIKKYYPKNKKEFDNTDFLSIKQVNKMPELIEDMISKDIISFKKLENGKYVPLELIEKYHEKLDMDYVLYKNNNITIDFLKNKVLIWYPNLELDLSSYMRIENCNQKNVEYFMEFINTKFTNEDKDEYYSVIKQLAEDYKDRYSSDIIKFINNKEKIEHDYNSGKDIASIEDPGVVFNFFIRGLHERINNES